MTRNQRLLFELTDLRMGPAFTVEGDDSTVVVTHTGGGRAVVWTDRIDGRRRVTDDQVTELVESVAETFRRDSRDPRYTAQSRAASAAAVADLPVLVG